MGDGLLGVALFVGEDEGCGEGGNVEAEVEEGVAMGGEGGGLGMSAGCLRIRFGVEVVRRAGAARAGESGERDGRLGEVECGGVEDAVVVDGGYIGAGGDAVCDRRSRGVRKREAACAQKMRRLVGMCVRRLRKGITRTV